MVEYINRFLAFLIDALPMCHLHLYLQILAPFCVSSRLFLCICARWGRGLGRLPRRYDVVVRWDSERDATGNTVGGRVLNLLLLDRSASSKWKPNLACRLNAEPIPFDWFPACQGELTKNERTLTEDGSMAAIEGPRSHDGQTFHMFPGSIGRPHCRVHSPAATSDIETTNS